MGNLVLYGATSGSTTLAPTDTANVTATLPNATGTVMVSGNMPAFSAYKSASQTINNGATVKLQFNTKVFDTNSNYDNVTNYRFTPTVAGYYQVNLAVQFNEGGSGAGNYVVYIYKNGTNSGQYNGFTSSGYNPTGFVSLLIYLNGSSDYIEAYAFQNYASPATVLGTDITGGFFQAALIRTA
jgi:hypothetical protein